MEVVAGIVVVWLLYRFARWLFSGSEPVEAGELPEPAEAAPAAPTIPDVTKMRQIQRDGKISLADDELPEFRVVALGNSGSGKTVFVGCAYREIAAFRRRPIRFEAPHKQRQKLHRIARLARDPAKTWPGHTRTSDMTEYEFTIMAKMPDADEAALRLVYLDYAGELLEDTKNVAMAKSLEANIPKAQALFGIIDGVLLAAWLRGDPEGLAYIDGSLAPILVALGNARCPIHFVITKWDLVRDIGERSDHDESRLRVVREALTTVPQIEDLVETSEERGRSIRLLPVSSVGDGFARVNDIGQVEKVGASVARPINLAVPFAAVIPDFLATAEARLSEQASAALVEAEPAGLFTMKNADALRDTAAALGPILPRSASASFAIAATMLHRYVRYKEERRDDLELVEPGGLGQAQILAMESCRKLIAEFEGEHPSSLLADRWGPR